MKQAFELPSGGAFLRFQIDLQDVELTVTLRWSARFELYNVDLHEGDRPIALGRALHPEIDLLHGLNLGWGKLYLEGAAPTPENLGIANRLIHES